MQLILSIKIWAEVTATWRLFTLLPQQCLKSAMKYGIVFPPSAEKQSFVSRLIEKRYILNAKVSPALRDLSTTPKHFGFTSIFEVSL